MLRYINRLKPDGAVSDFQVKFRMFLLKCAATDNIQDSELVNHFVNDDWFAGICWGAEKNGLYFKGEVDFHLNEIEISRALEYWFKKATREVKEFNKKETVERIGVERDEILYCKSRIMDGQKFLASGDFDQNALGIDINLNLWTPLIDRYSPIAYCIALYIHVEVCKHSGFETCYRTSLGLCHIIQGASLFREIAEECSKCSMMRKKYLDVAMGPISDRQLTMAPPFHTAICDLDGPYDTYVPGHERKTRNRQVLTAKVYILSFACPVTKMINLQVIEAKSIDGIVEGVTRFSCEQGFPRWLVLDQESSFMAMVKRAEVELKDLQSRTFKEYGIICKVSPVAGHNFSGLIERRIRSVQEGLEKIGLKKMRLHSLGLQTLAKLVVNDLINVPITAYGRSDDNTPILKLLTPNLMKVGRLHNRSLNGPIKMPEGPKDLMVKVEEIYKSFYKLFNTAIVPKLIAQPKWFSSSPELKPGDVVYFRKTENELSSDWTVGQVENIVRNAKDQQIRQATVRYHNANETNPRFSDRAVRSLVRLFNIEDSYFVRDMAEVESIIKRMEEEYKKDAQVKPIKLVKNADGVYSVKASRDIKKSCTCCCDGHCKMNEHSARGKVTGVSLAATIDLQPQFNTDYHHIYDRCLQNEVDDDAVEFTNQNECSEDKLLKMTSMRTSYSSGLQ